MSWITGKRVLVTGGTGFLGKALCRKLRAMEPDNLMVQGSKACNLTIQDETDTMVKCIWFPDTIIHLAAEVGGIGANQKNPGRFFYANMAMGLNLIESARKFGVGKFVQIGTICSYPKYTEPPFKETDLWKGYPEETNAPYGIAKKALFTMLQAYRQQYGFNGIYLMPVNLYGPGDNFDLGTSHVIPALIRKCEEAKKANADEIVSWGTGNVSREFLYVEDCADAIIAATEKYDDTHPINIGTGKEVRIDDLVKTIVNLTGFKGKITRDLSRPDGQPCRCLDTSFAKMALGWEAKVSLNEGLRKTIDWYRENLG